MLTDPEVLGRYAIYDEIAAGGMATVHHGRLLGPVGFARNVAIKRLHPQFARDPDFASMFLDEARLAARVSHPNVVGTIDVVATEKELVLVMEYIHGESLARLARTCRARGTPIPLDVVGAIMSGVLHGLHAAHEARSERGEPLGIVHRDVSPQNILVGSDGVPRVLDFGIARAAGRSQTTREGVLKGKIPYMAPEQVRRFDITRAVDVYASGVVLWELLTSQPLFTGDNEAILILQVIEGPVSPPSSVVASLPPSVDALVMKAISRDPDLRHASAEHLAMAIEATLGVAPASAVRRWIESVAGSDLDQRAQHVAAIEQSSQPAAVPMTLPAQGVTSASRARPRLWPIALFAAVLAVAVALLAMRFRATTLTVETAAIASASSSGPSMSLSASQPDQVPAVTVDLESASSPVPSAQPTARASSPTSTGVPGGTKTLPPAGASRCDPPYRIDANGRRKWKPECM